MEKKNHNKQMSAWTIPPLGRRTFLERNYSFKKFPPEKRLKNRLTADGDQLVECNNQGRA